MNSSNSKILLGVVYAPHGHVHILEQLLGDIGCRYDNTIILGDFNNNLFINSKAELIRNLCFMNNLFYVHNNIPTHFDSHYNKTSLIDYIFVSNNLKAKCSGEFITPSLSHHSFIYGCFDVSPEHVHNRVREFKDYKCIDWDKVNNTASLPCWNQIFFSNNVDFQMEIFYQFLHSLHDAVPTRKVNIQKKI